MLHIKIDRESASYLSKQIYNSIKEFALCGTIQPGEKLPSSRDLSKYLNIARNVVIESYEQLIAEGYAYSKSGSGTYICEGVQFQKTKVDSMKRHYISDNYITPYDQSLIFGYGNTKLDEIEAGINKLHSVIGENRTS
ncbi:winged helix-turn-helix domain-containing protein [Petroclostridium sp. X23]|uniref:winged helix-turn-helix domain-containing protein n=1 Tax=Petroclostridium sp. X23 TaxID=3045146 RepID=UPI0024AD1836|nr:winged helix-turn-helix domain-containing protein [Petroclostridium sp. X23]WHH57742.1 winged helix-turn-helix domain-containing protein [Petroclostridium sp. X23]